MSPKPLLASILMMQQTLTAFEKYGKTTRRAQFLAEMDVHRMKVTCALANLFMVRRRLLMG
jgi:hypothetical protein